jgi:hypothetical protein
MDMSFSLFAGSRHLEQSRKGHAIWFNTYSGFTFEQQHGKQEDRAASMG